MENVNTHAILGLILFMMLATTVFVATIPAFGLSAQTSHREPIPPIPNDPPAQPACPEMDDSSCDANGRASDPVLSMAASMAQLACDPRLEKCITKENREKTRNRTACEAAGCVFTFQTNYQPCTCSTAPGGDCNSETPDGGTTVYTCVADGAFNIHHYHCDPPASGSGTGPGGTTGGSGGATKGRP